MVPNREPPMPVIEGFDEFLDTWLPQASLDLVKTLRFAALPHGFDLALLRLLLETTQDAEHYVAQLRRLGFLTELSPGWYCVEVGLRASLLRRWQTETPRDYRHTSAFIAEYFGQKPGLDEEDSVEVVYHLLGADDEEGLQALAGMLEHAWSEQRLGLIERVLQYAEEQAPILGVKPRSWLRYHWARLDLAYNRYASSEPIFRALVSSEVEPRLTAQASLGLAETLVVTQRWSEAQDYFERAQEIFHQIDDPLNQARTGLAQGLSYLHLAASLGSNDEGIDLFATGYQTWLYRLQYAPFLAYRWLSQRASFLPSLYFGNDFQDWVTYRLFYEAIAQFERASRELARQPTPDAGVAAAVQTDIRIYLADLYHRVGRWPEAGRLFRGLAASPEISADNYRRAVLRLAQGRAAFEESSFDAARQLLQEAGTLFGTCQDHRALAITSRLQGDTEVALGNFDQAISFYHRSQNESLAVSDLLAATDVADRIEKLRNRFPFSAEARTQADVLDQRLTHRAYIIRFRNSLLSHFRSLAGNLAMYLVLPLTYLVMSVIHLLNLDYLVVALVYWVMQGLPTPVVDLCATLVMIGLSLLPALWLYGFFYIVFGWLFVRRMSIANIGQLQVEHVVTFPDGISLRNEAGQLAELPWEAVETYTSLNRSILRAPLALFSRVALLSHSSSLIVEGTASQYQALQSDIVRRLRESGSPASIVGKDFSLLVTRWTFVALAISLCLTTIYFFDWLDVTCRTPNITSITHDNARRAYLVSLTGDLSIVDAQDPETLRTLSSSSLAQAASDLALIDDTMYVAAGNVGLLIVDVSNPDLPDETSRYDTPGQATGVAVKGHLALVADGVEGLRILDVSTPQAPVELSSLDTPGIASGVFVQGHYAYVADGPAGLQIIDIRKPTRPAAIGSYDTPGEALAVVVAGEHAYVADGRAGLRIVHIRNLQEPVEISSYATPGQTVDIEMIGQIAFLADGTGGLHIVDVTQTDAPRLASSLDTEGTASGIAVQADLAYVADRVSGLWLADVLNPCDDVTKIGHYAEVGLAGRVAVPAAEDFPISSIAFEMVFWMLLIVPIIGLLRLLVNRRQLRRIGYARLSIAGDRPLWLALILLVVLVGFHLWTLTL